MVWPPRTLEDLPRMGQLPPYVFARIATAKLERQRAGRDVIDLGMGNPDIGAPPHVVEELVRFARDPRHHRYSASRGIHGLREALAEWYGRRWGVAVDPETEVVVTIGVKEGLAHLMVALLEPGAPVLVPSPAYPIHTYAPEFAGGRTVRVPFRWDAAGRADEAGLLADLAEAARRERARVVLVSFPHNPTTTVVTPRFFERLVAWAHAEGILLVHDFAYADFGFEAPPPSLLAVPGAKDVAVEFFSFSKSYGMAGWRVGACVGQATVVAALTKLKSYLDYGIFQPIQIAAIAALRGPQTYVTELRERYRRRRDALVEALRAAGWNPLVAPGTMFLWAPLPEPWRSWGSLEAARWLLEEADVAVSPGVGFGPEGEGYVRFALIAAEERLAEAGQRLARAWERAAALSGPAKARG